MVSLTQEEVCSVVSFTIDQLTREYESIEPMFHLPKHNRLLFHIAPWGNHDIIVVPKSKRDSSILFISFAVRGKLPKLADLRRRYFIKVTPYDISLRIENTDFMVQARRNLVTRIYNNLCDAYFDKLMRSVRSDGSIPGGKRDDAKTNKND